MSEILVPTASMRNTWYSRSDKAACGGPSACGIAPSASSSATSALMKAPPDPTLRIAGDKLGRRAVLGQIARRPGLDRAHRVLMLLVHAEHENTQLGFLDLDLLDQLHAAFAGHRHVEQQHVEVVSAHVLQHFVAIARLAHDVDVACRKQQLLQPLADDGVVVGDDDANHCRVGCGGKGRRTSMLVPRPGVLVMAASPPRR